VRNPDSLKGRVLVIDDDTSTLMVLSKAFNREAYDVETAGSAREALARLTRSDFDVVISDIRMPEFDGKHLFSFIQDHFPDYRSRIVFLTGDASKETLDFIADSGAMHFTKPPDLRELLDTIAGMVRGHAPAAPVEAAAAPSPSASATVAATHQVTRLSLEAAQLRREVADRERDISALTARVDRASHEIAAARLQATTTTEELNSLRDEVAEKERELTRVTRKLEHTEAQAQSERETLQAELDRLRAQMAQTATELEAHRSEASRRGAELQALREEHARREAELEAAQRESARRTAELQARLRLAEAATAHTGSGAAAAVAPAEIAIDARSEDMEEMVVTFYRSVVRPLTIASAHLELAQSGDEPMDAETLAELNAATAEIKRRLSDLAHRMEALGIKVTSP
jgi:DNA-binding response OmpR family regulator